MKYFACLFLFTVCISPFVETQGQIAKTTQAISVSFTDASLPEIAEKLEEKCVCRIFLAHTDENFSALNADFQDQSVEEILSSILKNTSLSFLSYDQQLITIGKKSSIALIQNVASYQILEENIEFLSDPNPSRTAIGSIENVSPGDIQKISGRIRDEETGEGIEGASILLQPGEQGARTDDKGNYSLEAEAGSYELIVQYIGYRKRRVPIRLISSGNLDVSLIKADIQLDEIVLEAYASDGNVESNQTGLIRINMKELEKLPSFLGEVDVVKSLLLQPGVSSIGEGSSGFNVRGGNTDQNLVLLDEAILFNSSHALGFFSSFNADIVQDASLYKGSIPAKFGGRISSVLDVGVKEGNYEKVKVKGGLGLVSSRLMIEGPLNKNKTSFLVSGRSTYSDWLLNAVRIPEVKASSAFFYDANLKLTHRFDDRNILSLSLYQSKDR
ncbi:MAG: TonB-dependent receptor, partial [Bacteroidota bacterium]